MIETLVSSVVFALGLGLLSGTVYAFRQRSKWRWYWLASTVFYVPGLAAIISVFTGIPLI